MTTSLNEIVECLASFSTETGKIGKLNEQAGQCREILKYIEDLKKEGPHAINKLAQRSV